MRGIVIAGGLGTRLRPLTLSRPKPLMPLVNTPLLEYQLTYLKEAGIKEVCFATNYMADAIEKYFGDGSSLGIKLVYALEKEPLDTGGAIRNAYDVFPGDDCVIFNGDTIHAFDISAIIRSHRERNADVTLTLREVRRPHPYGVIKINEEERVLGFYEPTEEQKRMLSNTGEGSDYINAGLYVINADILEMFPSGRCNVEREVFPKLISEGKRIYGNIQNAYWIDIGRPSQYMEAVRAVLNGSVKSPKPFRKYNSAAIDDDVELHPEAKISGFSSIGKGVKIEKGAEIIDSIILEETNIGEGAKVRNSIIGERSCIGAFSRIENSVLGAQTVVPEYSIIGEVP
ncbi:MAG TPA: NDP-sugar synthase [Fimbriimonadales bacterium]|nr:NDP-sugar synthase [Fimbriimonadales bacterium]